MIVASERRTLVLRSVLLALAIGGLAWAAVIAVTGGVVLDHELGTPVLRASRSTRFDRRPRLCCAMSLLFRQHAAGGCPPSGVAGRPQVLAAVLVAAALVIGIRWGTFVASASDASGYVSQAGMWLKGELTTLAPEWAHDAPWQDAAWSSAPLGYRRARSRTCIVPTYSPGLPIMMALFKPWADGTPSITSCPASVRWRSGSPICLAPDSADRGPA